MPELPDITLYVEHLERRVAGATLVRVRVVSPSLLMTVDPPLEAVEGRQVTAVRRMGKRIVFVLDGDLYLVLHLMVAGRLQWKDPGAKVPGRIGLAAFEFTTGTLILTEASTRRRATLHAVAGRRAVSAFGVSAFVVFFVIFVATRLLTLSCLSWSPATSLLQSR